jgi:hypothetical protein
MTAFCKDQSVAMVHCEGFFKGNVDKTYPDFKYDVCVQPMLSNTMQNGVIPADDGAWLLLNKSNYPDPMWDFLVWSSDYERTLARFLPEGYTPPFQKFITDSRNTPFFQKTLELFPYVRGFTNCPKSYQVDSQVIEPGLQNLILGKAKPADLATSMDAQITTILTS